MDSATRFMVIVIKRFETSMIPRFFVDADLTKHTAAVVFVGAMHIGAEMLVGFWFTSAFRDAAQWLMLGCTATSYYVPAG